MLHFHLYVYLGWREEAWMLICRRHVCLHVNHDVATRENRPSMNANSITILSPPSAPAPSSYLDRPFVCLSITPHHDIHSLPAVTARVSECAPPSPCVDHASESYTTAVNPYDHKSFDTSSTASEVGVIASPFRYCSMSDIASARHQHQSKEVPSSSRRSVLQHLYQ